MLNILMLSVIILSVILLSVIMLNVIMLSVVMLSVVAPWFELLAEMNPIRTRKGKECLINKVSAALDNLIKLISCNLQVCFFVTG